MMLMPKKIRNAEGYCKKCGASLGISGQCPHCVLREMEERNRDFLKSRTLSWWREYWKGAIGVLEGQLKRSPTMPEKILMLKRWRENIRNHGAPGSYTSLALITALMDIEDKE